MLAAEQPLCGGVEESGGAEEERPVLVVEEGVEGVEDGRADGLAAAAVAVAVVLEEVVQHKAQLGICGSKQTTTRSVNSLHQGSPVLLCVDRNQPTLHCKIKINKVKT